ncbi:MAG: hypothetical protein DWI00_00035 [Planctomycetota bacterium]|nr:MAG: hypothetical protein DWI00_00035 [Planctomycetota bacterium]
MELMMIANSLRSFWTRLSAVTAVMLAAVVAPVGAASIEETLSKNTLLFARITNAKALREAFEQTQFGRLIEDPALKPIRADVAKNLEKFSADVKSAAGVTLSELLTLPTGPMHIAVIPGTNEKVPVGFYASLDAGDKASAFTDAMSKLIKFGTEKGSKVSTETFNEVSISVITSEIKDDDGKATTTTFALAKTGTVFHLGTSVDVLKSVIKGAGADNLASSDDYRKAVTKFRPGSQIQFFANVPATIKVIVKAAAANVDNAAVDAQQIETIVNMLGLNGIKAAAGSITLNDTTFDVVSSTSLLLAKPVDGLLKVFKLKPSKMEPEAWVPANLVSYQSLGWDLDTAYTAINDIVNMFQPGLLNVLEQQLVGPNGGDPLSFQKDLFGPLGNRITIISDLTKPIKADSQRTLVGVALEDSAVFTKTLQKLFDLGGLEPKKREFQGTTIFEIEPNLPQAGGVNVDSGPLSIAIAKDTLFITSEVTLLESVLRGGAPKLADSAAYKAVAKFYPAMPTSISFTAAEEAARSAYDMIKQGQLDVALDAAAGQAGQKDAPDVDNLFDIKKLPDYSVFAKFLTNTGGFSTVDDDGVTAVQFSLRKANP